MSINRSSILGGLVFCVVIIALVLFIEEEELSTNLAYENSFSSSVVFRHPTKDFENSLQIPKAAANDSKLPDEKSSNYKMREKKLRNSRRNPVFRTREFEFIESKPLEERLWYTMELLEKYPKKDRQPLYYNKTEPTKVFEVDDEAFSGGGFGSVFFATRIEDGMRVVIKAGRIDKSGGQNHLTTEATVMSHLDHPNILKSLDVFLFEQVDSSEELSGGIWLALPLMDGGPLSQFVRSKAFAKKKWGFTEPQMAFAAKEILSGIYYMHKRDIFHRDLKLHNILVGMNGTIVIADFGFAHFKWKGDTYSFPGTLYWQAPEILKQDKYDLAVDIWAFGVMMRELSEGRAPYAKDKLTEVDFINKIIDVGQPDFYDPSLWSKDFMNFTMSALIHDKDQRLTAAQLLQHPWLKKACTKEEFSMALKNGTQIMRIEG